MTQEKKVEDLRSVYMEMDEARRKGMEQLAEGLLNIQMVVDNEKLSAEKKKNSALSRKTP